MSKARKPATVLPFYKITADQLVLDLIAIDTTTGIPVGKPTISILHDSVTKEILSSSVPIKALVIDNGKELEATGLENLCSILGISLIRHPSFKPQFKGVVERHFGKQNRESLLKSLKSSKNYADRIPPSIKKRDK